MYKTNFRIIDDYHRTNAHIAFLLSRGLAHTGRPKDAAQVMCMALERNYDPGNIAYALKENHALNGPARCIESDNRTKCVEQSAPPDSPAFRPPFDAGACESWVEHFAEFSRQEPFRPGLKASQPNRSSETADTASAENHSDGR